MYYVYEYLIAAMVMSLVILVCFFRKRTITTRISMAFTALVVSIFFTALLNLTTVFTIHYSKIVPLWINYFVNMLYLLVSTTIPISFYFCIISYIETDKSHISKFSLFYRKVIIALGIILSILILSTPLTSIGFYFDENKVYTHGKLFFLPYVVTSIVILSTEFYIIKNRKLFTKQQKFVILFYSFGVLGAIVIQLITVRNLTIEFASAIAALLIYLSLDDPASYQDKEMDIYNKRGFKIVTTNLFSRKKNFSVLIIKISGFSYLGNKIGFNNYKRLMKAISQQIENCTHTHQIFRLSQSKVAVIFKNQKSDLNQIIENLKSSFENPVNVSDINIAISIRMLTLNCPQDAGDSEETLKLIDYATKNIETYEPNFVLEADKKLVEKRESNLKLVNVLKSAINQNQFYIVYQPIYSNKENKFTSAEALIRLNCNGLGMNIGPDVFIPLAEKNGLMMRIGEFVFNSVCQFISKEKIWEKGIEYIHVNLSTIQCMQENLHTQLLKIMDSYELNHKYINLEVTETTAIASSSTFKHNMNNLINNGLHFALDDYGSGFSNISTLVKYPFSTIKLDKSLIDLIITNDSAKIIIKNTIKMIKSLKMEIVAEGVETQEQIDFLKDYECDYIQGYFYSKPLKEDQYLDFLEKNNK